MLESLLNKKNFGSYILEITSSENDGDHYQTNLEFEKNLNKVLTRFYYLCKAARSETFIIEGTEFENLQQVSRSDKKDRDGHYIADYVLENIGYAYESSMVREVESVKLYFLDEQGILNEF